MSLDAPTSHPRRQLRQPRVAEMIAAILRDRIVNGELLDGDFLPKQDDLLEEFQVSRPSIREAMRILETEGLITVRRGNIGGAVAHTPKAEDAAYMLGLVLQSRHVTFGDLARALGILEPACAALCATRPDRDSTVVPVLSANIDQSATAVEDGPRFTQLARLFHDQLVATCGNETMILVVGTLEALWSSQEEKWARQVHSEGRYPEQRLRKAVIGAHQRILDAIANGDPDQASRAARRHLDEAQPYLLSDGEQRRISAGELRLRVH